MELGGGELRELQSLAERVSGATGYHHVGDLAWNSILDRDARWARWRDGNTVTGWAWLDGPDSAMLQVDPAVPAIVEEMLDWAEAGGASRFELARTETALIAAVSRRGYRRDDGPFMLCLRRPLTGLGPTPPLPDGLRCRPVRADDAESWLATHVAAFGRSRLTGDDVRDLMRIWPFQPEFSLLIEAPDGTCAAYCQGWYDAVNRIGEFEPVGTHPAHQRRGLARAVCHAVLLAFAAAGGEQATVYARGDEAYPVPRAVYRSLGFTGYTRTDWFCR